MPPTLHVAVSDFSRGHVLAGRYVLERLLGEGGMGTVWCARQLTTDRPVALKFLKGDDPADRARFLREAKVAAGLSHRNIVQVFDFWEIEDGPVFLVMELLAGESLAHLLSHRGALALAEMVSVLLPVAQALSAAHAEGIVHRDLKPENVFLARTRSGEVEVKVVDFGLARRVTAPAGATAVTQTGAIMGTPHYMAPEQVYGEGDIDARADVWALGVILYQCATGRLPFDGENFGQIFRAISQGQVRPVREVRPELPPTFDHVVQRALSHDRNARPRMDEIARALSSGFSPMAFAPTLPVSDAPPPMPPLALPGQAVSRSSAPPPVSRERSQPPGPFAGPGGPVGPAAPASTFTDVAVTNARLRAPALPAPGGKGIAIAVVAVGLLVAFAAGVTLTRRLSTSSSSVAAATQAPPVAQPLPLPLPVQTVTPALAVEPQAVASDANANASRDAAAPAPAVAAPSPASSPRRRTRPASPALPASDDPAALLNQGRF
jgi:serine/threonine-protein kinase